MDRPVRRVVRARLDPSLVQASIDALTQRAPSDRIRATEHGWLVREEIPWFLLVFAIALFALALLGHAGLARTARLPRSFQVLPWLFDTGWIASAWLFVRQLWSELSIALEGKMLVIARSFRGRVLTCTRLDPENVLAVRVTDDRIVSIEGPHPQKPVAVFIAGPLDPPTLARWIADCIVSLCERAQAR
jgi:hypothetical protein